MMAGAKILDGHLYLLTTETEREDLAWLPPMSSAMAFDAAAARWLAELDRFGVAAAVFLALAPRPEALRRFVTTPNCIASPYFSIHYIHAKYPC